mmetsp:Transcript_26294/g.62352  ORF Transcript_26294/g.62352 Transcript_26294/m.62352 type:complete len:295 (+) Transcript_26294:686-1570(+)
MPRPADALAGRHVDGLVLNRQFHGGLVKVIAAVRAQHRVVGQCLWQHRLERSLAGVGQHEVAGFAGAVAHHQYGHLFGRHPALGSFAAAPARCPLRLSGQPCWLALVREQLVRLVSLDNTGHVHCLGLARAGQPAMAPTKGGRAVHAESGGRFANAQSFVEHLGLVEPLVAVAQPRQRCAGQRIEGDTAVAALVSLQPIGKAIAHHVLAVASRAHRSRGQPLLDAVGNFVDGLGVCKLMEHQLALVGCQPPQRIAQPLQFVRLHLRLPVTLLSPPTQSRTQQAHWASLSPFNAN